MRKNFLAKISLIFLLGVILASCQKEEKNTVTIDSEKVISLLKHDSEQFRSHYLNMDLNSRTELFDQLSRDTSGFIQAMNDDAQVQTRDGWKGLPQATLSWNEKGLFSGPFTAPSACNMRIFAETSEDSPILILAAVVQGYRNSRINVSMSQCIVISLTIWCGELPSGSMYADIATGTETCDGLGSEDIAWVRRWIPKG